MNMSAVIRSMWLIDSSLLTGPRCQRFESAFEDAKTRWQDEG
jgi:hypothetical protein